ncbi:MAG TPA: putative baseplate assembly protein, partial [Acidimicrobiales bacterium]
MALPAPNLDDRRFQELVDEAKRMVMRRCPEWTDHNVSDPGVTLIETFAYMTDLMLYRLNRVPERLYIKFLDLIGLQLFPPTAGRAPVTFWLSTNLDQPMTIPTATRVATLRTEHEESEVFTTIDELALIPCAYQSTMTKGADGEALVDRTEQMHLQAFAAFSDRPTPGDALMIGLTEAVPSNAVSLRVRCRIDGVGVDPTNPPLRWEAYDGTGWQECDLERDDTGGLNRDGEIVLHVPSSHRPGVFEGVRAGWIRCVVIAAEEGQPEYSSSPIV